MKTATRYKALTLALHPSTYGVAWVAFENPFMPYDWGLLCAKGANKNEVCLRKLTRLIARLNPETIVLEAFEKATSIRRTRVTYLCRSIVTWAMEERIDVAVYRFVDVRATFSHLGGRTRQQIAEILARQFWAFKHLLPQRRRSWDSEPRNGPLFSAVALIVTHYQRDAIMLLESIAGP